MARKIFIIAGEASGDLHGANLAKALYSKDPTVQIQSYGGDKLRQAGAKVIRDYRDYAFMGFLEVFRNLPKVLSNLNATVRAIEKFEPDILIFIDFPAFNLRVAKRLRNKLQSTKFYYYISPKVWAWKSGRVHLLNKLMDQIFVIFPFEEAFYRQFGYHVTYVGNPILDELAEIRNTGQRIPNLVAVLPGSRKQEIERMLPIFAQLSKRIPDFEFEVSKMRHIDLEFYQKHAVDAGGNFHFSTRATYDLVKEARLALVTSGTATLETALLNTPQIVAYKTSRLSYEIGKRLIQTKYISLVNLILNREAVKELIQDELNVDRLYAEVQFLIRNDAAILSDYEALREKLGEPGASNRVAALVLGGV